MTVERYQPRLFACYVCCVVCCCCQVVSCVYEASLASYVYYVHYNGWNKRWVWVCMCVHACTCLCCIGILLERACDYSSACRYNEWVIESRIHGKASGNVFNEKWQSKYSVCTPPPHTYTHTHTHTRTHTHTHTHRKRWLANTTSMFPCHCLLCRSGPNCGKACQPRLPLMKRKRKELLNEQRKSR